MTSKTISLALAASLTLAAGIQTSLRAEDPPAPQRPPGAAPREPGGPGFGLRGPWFDSLSQEEKDKLKAVSEKALQDAKVQEARQKMEAAGKEFRDALRAAQIAADPSIEPILKKVDEAREKMMQERGGARRGDQPKK